MKTPLLLLGVFALLQGTTEADPVYQNDFSGTNPPRSSWEIGGRAASGFDINVNSVLESGAGNQYARVNVTTLGGATDAGWRWYGGWYDKFAGLTAFPAEFRFSFDVSHAPVEPIRLTLTADSIKAPGQLWFVIRTYWVQPDATDWRRLTIDQNSPYSEAAGTWTTSESPNFWMEVFLASHDERNTPLSISTDGTRGLFIDNVVFEVVPEPTTASLVTLVGAGAIIGGMCQYMSRRRSIRLTTPSTSIAVRCG